jgi:hypothetical protein
MDANGFSSETCVLINGFLISWIPMDSNRLERFIC